MLHKLLSDLHFPVTWLIFFHPPWMCNLCSRWHNDLWHLTQGMLYAYDNGIALDGKLRPLTSLALQLPTPINMDICMLFPFSFNRGYTEKEINNNLLYVVYFLAKWHLSLNETSIKIFTESIFPSLLSSQVTFFILCWHLVINGFSMLKKNSTKLYMLQKYLSVLS